MKKLITLISAFLIMTSSAENPKNGKEVLNLFTKAQIPISEIKEEKWEQGSNLPNCYVDHFVFVHDSVAPSGGQIFTFTKKKYADSVYEYYKALESLAGPYLYRSSDGLVVAQLNKGLNVMQAEAIEELLANIKMNIGE